jgi:hypothetical protein
MKDFLRFLGQLGLSIVMVIVAFFGTIFMFWPFIAIVLLFCVLFWIFLPIIGWIIFILMMILLIFYLIINLFN